MADGVRLGEVLICLSVAIDLGLGLPMETMMRTAVLSRRLASAAGLSEADVAAAYHLALLRFIGCTTSSHSDADLFGDELGAAPLMSADDGEMLGALRRSIGRGEPVAQRALRFGNAVTFALSGALAAQHSMHCEAAALLAARIGMSPEVRSGIVHLYERWDGRGNPTHLQGEAISRPMRAVLISQLAAVLAPTTDAANVAQQVKSRAGRQFDPSLAAVFAENATELLRDLDGSDIARLAIEAEPGPRVLDGTDLDVRWKR